MAWVVSKIIGDGLSPETAYRTAAQQYGLSILNADHIPVDPKTGKPTSDFALLQVKDGEEAILKNELGCFVLPKDQIDVNAITTKLAVQGCIVDLKNATSSDAVIALVAAKVNAEKESVK